MSDLLPFGPGAWAFIALYLALLLLLGWAGRAARKEDTLQDFYLGGRGFGFFVLLLTLYATQYSGNTIFGVAGATYRFGFGWLISVHYMLAIIVFYLAFAPQLHKLSRDRGYVTPADYLQDRFESKAISLIGSIVMIVALNNYLLAQLMTLGRAMQGLAGPLGDEAYNYGVIGLALIMLIYGTLGGLRAIAWTDVVQGGVLLVGFFVLLVLLIDQFGPLSAATARVVASPDAFKVARPEPAMLREWVSYVIVIGVGGALYPHAIQRIYAARSRRTIESEPGQHDLPALCDGAGCSDCGYLCSGLRAGSRGRCDGSGARAIVEDRSGEFPTRLRRGRTDLQRLARRAHVYGGLGHALHLIHVHQGHLRRSPKPER